MLRSIHFRPGIFKFIKKEEKKFVENKTLLNIKAQNGITV